ncbi:hypothetical protein CANCADRAFT_140644 [Tortispora caseinolytica NRRL Y-17796]|uniref:allantoicase n=1 Tax=Tortispora caseinolytica NRRL Y-17796 TaxID=767744 RepID=A0A1E4TCS4_9ASCO|nr:hypothetical protein CANCADRAFT_140644 [Tortispora caseinolytica NRRL Y-17796]
MSRQISTEEAAVQLQAKYTDVVGQKVGGSVISVSDEWFAEAANLLKPNPPVSHKGQFSFTGAVFDGWETRRHNPDHDWVIIKTGVNSATIRGVEVDTGFFDGNHAPEIDVEATFLKPNEDIKNAKWIKVIDRHECGPAQRHHFILPSETNEAYTHVRLNMYPDGGIGRFRVWGRPVVVLPEDKNAIIDFAAVANGGQAISCSDQHFGTIDNLLLPGRGKDMGDGWETKRSRGKDHIDWAIIRLGAPTIPDHLLIDTAHFRGNFPKQVKVEGLYSTEAEDPTVDDTRWNTLLDPQDCKADAEHVFKDLKTTDKITHVKLIIIPDGGVKRIRVFGKIAE